MSLLESEQVLIEQMINTEKPYQRQASSKSGTSSQVTSVTGSPINNTTKSTRRVKDSCLRINHGHWSNEEHQTYVNFLMRHEAVTKLNQENKKNNKIFKLMSETIGTRSPSQCRLKLYKTNLNRSHHQKFNPFSTQGQKNTQKTRKRTKIDNPKVFEISRCLQTQYEAEPEAESQAQATMSPSRSHQENKEVQVFNNSFRVFEQVPPLISFELNYETPRMFQRSMVEENWIDQLFQI